MVVKVVLQVVLEPQETKVLLETLATLAILDQTV
jgi:hypothetical protein